MNVGIVKSMAILGIGGVGLRAQYIFPNSANHNLVGAINQMQHIKLVQQPPASRGMVWATVQRRPDIYQL
ncbi:hypothetical protein N7537_007079 [Penicillium hordei]|uniref:Uncharacterized protein n=1 Tax=Penicillium hordei TaxID=40994 RepID=A0AAD6E8S7_9EURO|nr:uncharacterized protein N7537_007079 [Penicillium hordei]KAJ5604123.1 hypothetical protein N7537_007079 [Penicillium hordei]